MTESKHSYVVCVENSGCPESLEVRKIYLRLPDRRAEEDGFLRVIDESGEDYLFPSRFFVAIEISSAIERALAAATARSR